MVQSTYSAPVDALLRSGETRVKRWPNYMEKFNLSLADVPELLRMVVDEDLNFSDDKSSESWAPVHAWRALGQLRAEAAIEPLISCFDEMVDNDWFREEMPEVFSLIGPTAIPAIAEFLANPNDLYLRWMCAAILVKMSQKHPDVRNECLNRLVNQLQQYTKNSRELNGALVCALIDIEAKEAVPLMEAAFSAKRVDTSIPGDWIDVQYALGLLTQAEVTDLRYYVDAEQVGVKTMRHQAPATGFGQGVKRAAKEKKRK
jgi:hypothetical protein